MSSSREAQDQVSRLQQRLWLVAATCFFLAGVFGGGVVSFGAGVAAFLAAVVVWKTRVAAQGESEVSASEDDRKAEPAALDLDLLADQIDRAFRGESWHGTSVLEVLEGVSAQDAAAHPIPGAHGIWEIVHHLIAGYGLVLRRVRGAQVEYSAEDAWPAVTDVGEAAWRESQETLDRLNRELVNAVRAFPVERLVEPLGSEFPAYVQFCGAPQHDLYHAGQIVMLKKALAASRGKD